VAFSIGGGGVVTGSGELREKEKEKPWKADGAAAVAGGVSAMTMVIRGTWGGFRQTG